MQQDIQTAAQAELEIRRRFGTSFRDFVLNVKPDYKFYRHTEVLIEALDKVAHLEIKRLMAFEPRRMGKSETISRLFPAYYLFLNPVHHVGIGSYGAELAEGLSRDARENYLKTGRELGSAESVSEWHTAEGGRCWSAGVGGAIIGKGGECLILDDPYRSRAEAMSLAYRTKTYDWYQHVWYTCQHPHAAFVIVQTRWHADDLIGRLLEVEKNGDYPEKWHIINLEAIKEEKSQIFPVSCTISPDWRQPGEALCPEMFTVEDLMRIKSKNIDVWRAMYQQNPIAEEGNIWKLAWFKSYTEDSIAGVVLSNDGLDWDLNDGGDRADGENAACAFVRSSIGSDGKIYVSDCDFLWTDFAEQVAWMKRIDSPHYVEAKASGKSAVSSLQKSGVYAMEVKVRGLDKVSRTKLATPIASGDHVRIHKAIWEKLLYDDRQGILGFDAKPFKDLNDAFVQALNRHWVFDPTSESDEEPPEWWHNMGVGNASPRGNDWRDAHRY
jgi:hypothetical protein